MTDDVGAEAEGELAADARAKQTRGEVLTYPERDAMAKADALARAGELPAGGVE